MSVFQELVALSIFTNTSSTHSVPFTVNPPSDIDTMEASAVSTIIDTTEQLAKEYNQILETIATKVEKDRDLKAKLKFSIQLKTAPRWHQIYQFHGPDMDTTALLTEYRAWWTANPAHFFTQSLVPLQGVSHPLAAAAGQCLWREKHDAWGAMIRRAHLVNFSRMQKKFDLPVENMAEMLQSHFTSYSRADLISKVTELLRRGSVLEAFVQDTCPGFIYAMGQGFTDLWEQRIKKTGPQRKAVLSHLKSINFLTFASILNPMAEAIGESLFSRAETVVDRIDSLPYVEPGLSNPGRQGWDASLEIFDGPHAFPGTLNYSPWGLRS